MRSMLPFGIIIALTTLVLDQFSKHWLIYMYHLPSREVVEILPFFNLVTVWNTGISFGMLNNFGVDNATALIVLSSGITVALLVWLSRTTHPFLARGIGLVIGGGIGNIVDRMRFGAVFDFIDIHAYGFHWPAFNIADAAICVGVGLILLDSFLCKDTPSSSH